MNKLDVISALIKLTCKLGESDTKQVEIYIYIYIIISDTY